MSDSFYEGLAVWSQIAASILFIFAMVYIWVRFIAPAVLASQARKNADLADAEKRRDAARAEVDTAQAEVAAAGAEANAIGARAEADARRIRDKMLSDAGAEAERLIRNAEGELERSRGAARDAMRTELLERAMQIARRAAADVDEASNRRLIGEAVETAERAHDPESVA